MEKREKKKKEETPEDRFHNLASEERLKGEEKKKKDGEHCYNVKQSWLGRKCEKKGKRGKTPPH